MSAPQIRIHRTWKWGIYNPNKFVGGTQNRVLEHTDVLEYYTGVAGIWLPLEIVS